MPASTDRRFASLPFVWASLLAAAVPGFGAGSVLFIALLSGQLLGPWWVAATQAHGHAQAFGFAGLMVFGVAFYFLPRLRGAPLAAPHLLPVVLWLYAGGLLLRVLGQQAGPLVAQRLGPAALPSILFAGALAGSGPLELAGGTLALSLLARTGMRGPPLRTRGGVRQVLPLLVAAWIGLWLALACNATGTLAAGGQALTDALAVRAGARQTSDATWIVPAGLDALAVRLALLGWLVPLAVAFAARNFPLFLRTPLASPRSLRWGLALLVDGLVAEAASLLIPGGSAAAAAAGAALEGLALLWFTYAVGALGPKVHLPGRHLDPGEARLAQVTAWPLAGAFVWLSVAGVLLLFEASAVWGLWPPPPEDAQRHALGAGFLTLLIVGMGLRLLPGFAGPRRRRVGLGAAGVSIVLAHVAAVLRVVPPLLVWLVSAAGEPARSLTRAATGVEAVAGIAGVLAIAAFAVALRAPLQPEAMLTA